MQLWKVYVLLAATALLTACGPEGSGYAPATNAISAVPEDVIDVRPDDYELTVLPEYNTPPGVPTASYDTGDSSGGRTLVLAGLNPALEDTASDLQAAADAVVRANQAEAGNSPTIANETDDSEAEETVASEVADDAETGGTETGGEETGGEDDAEMADDLDGEAESTPAETGGEEMDSSETGGSDVESGEAENEETGGAETGGVGTEEVEVEATPADFDFDQELGESTYSVNCVACHQPNGEGIAGAFPPLAGHMPELYNAEGGREYIISTVLYGLQGGINVQGESYNGVMNAWAQLSNEEIAAALNHELTSWGNANALNDFSPIEPDEVEALRGQGLNGSQVMELRPELP